MTNEEDQQKAREMVYDWEEVYKPPNLQLFGTRAGLIDRIATAITETRAETREADARIALEIPESKFDYDHEPALTEKQIRGVVAAAIRAAAGDEK